MLATASLGRRVVVVLAGLRRRRCARPLRSNPRRRCCSRPTATSTTARASIRCRRCARSRRACPSLAAVVDRAVPQRRARPRRSTQRAAVRRVARGPRRAPLRARSVRRSALHSLFVGHDGRAEVHRARRRRHSAAAPQGARAAHGHPPRRRRVLFHDLRLDDVELARVGARVGRDARTLRRRPAASGSRRSVAPCRARARRRLRHEREISECAREVRLRAPVTARRSPRCARFCRPARRSRPRASTTCIAASKPTCSSRRSRAART